MSNRFLTHLSTVSLFHVLLLLAGWQLSHSEFAQPLLPKIQAEVMRLRVASRILISPAQQLQTKPQVVKQATKVIPKTSEVEVQNAPVISDTEPASDGGAVGALGAGSVNGTITDLRSIYKAELRAKIDQNKFYPLMSKRLGQTGVVVVAFTLLEDGKIIDVRLDTPSRFDSLNASALEAVKKVNRFRPIPKELGTQKMDLKIPVQFVTI